MEKERYCRENWLSQRFDDAIPELRHGVHLWQIPLVRAPQDLRALSGLLDDDEERRAARFHFANDRENFIIGRGSLRLILGGYLKTKPSGLRFSYGPNGKPEIDDGNDDSTLRFNLSHSHAMAVVAVTRHRRVGIDIEALSGDRLDPVEIAEACFSPDEQQSLRRVSPEDRIDLFYRIWTRREALFKGLGVGLSGFHGRLPVSLGQRQVAVPTASGVESGGVWSMEEFRVSPNYVGAVAVEGEPVDIAFRGTIDGAMPVIAGSVSFRE